MRVKQNPNLAVLEMLDKAEVMALQKAEEIIQKILPDIQNKAIEEIKSTVSEYIASKNLIEEFKGKSGVDGHTPTDAELRAIIKPLIPKLPKVQDGHTPTNQELLRLIRPLIPKVEHGETPTDERLLSLIKPLIPTVKDGSPDTAEVVVSKINTLEEAIEQSTIKGFRTLVAQLRAAIRENNSKGGKKQGVGTSITVSTNAPLRPYIHQLWLDIS